MTKHFASLRKAFSWSWKKKTVHDWQFFVKYSRYSDHRFFHRQVIDMFSWTGQVFTIGN